MKSALYFLNQACLLLLSSLRAEAVSCLPLHPTVVLTVALGKLALRYVTEK